MRLPNPKIVLEFKDFMVKTNMFAMAMGVVIGTAISKVVNTLVADLIMPIVGLVAPGGEWRAMKVWIFGVGNVMGTVLDFAIIAAVVFFITKVFMKPTPPAPAPPTKTCPQCIEAIHLDAKKCKHCASVL